MTIILTPDKALNSLIYGRLVCVIMYTSYKVFKMVRFYGPTCLSTVSRL